MGNSGTPGNQGTRMDNVSPGSRKGLHALISHLDDKNARWTLVLFLLGAVLQLVPWACSLLGINVNYPLGIVVSAASLIALAVAVYLSWTLSKWITVMLLLLVCGAAYGIHRAARIPQSVLKMQAHMVGGYGKPNQSSTVAELEIDNLQDEPLDRVDLWISRKEKLIGRISARPSGVSKCSYEPVDAHGTSVRAIFKGADGSRLAIDSREATESGLQATGSSKWHLYCERVGKSLPVILDLEMDGDGDPLGEHLRVSGFYETVLGSSQVPVNESVLITK